MKKDKTIIGETMTVIVPPGTEKIKTQYNLDPTNSFILVTRDKKTLGYYQFTTEKALEFYKWTKKRWWEFWR